MKGIGLGATGFFLAACAPAAPSPASGGSTESSPAAEVVTLRHQCRTGSEENHYTAERELFQQEHPNIQLEFEATPNSDYQQKLATLVAGGELGDAYWGNVFGQLYPFASAGIALDVGPLAEAKGWDKSDYFDVGIKQITWEGKLIGIPLAGHAGWTCMWTNISAFEETGTPLPEWEWTFQDQWLEAVQSASVDSDGDGEIDRFGFTFDYNAQNSYTFIRCWGGDWIDPEDRKTALVNSEPVVEALAFMRSLVHDYGVSPTEQQLVDDMFANGYTASWSSGIWNYGTFKETIGDKFEWQNFPMPAGPGGRGSFIGCDTYCINSGSSHPDEAFTWGQWLSSKEAGLRQLDRGISTPFHKEAWEDPKLADDPNFQALRQWLEIAVPWTVPGNARALEFRNTFNQGIQSVLNGENDFMTEIENLHKSIQGVLDKPNV